jgi:hypothetical protein
MGYFKKISELFTENLKAKPILLFQSDDWVKSGAKDLDCLKNIKSEVNPWDKYGTESAQDLQDIKTTFKEIKDYKGNCLQLTANIIFVNLDIEKSLGHNLEKLFYKPITEGFPSPSFSPVSKYKELIESSTVPFFTRIYAV